MRRVLAPRAYAPRMFMRRLFLFATAILTALAGCNSRSYSSGDRVLVSKFLYDTKLADPNRFEVVVFKYPRGPVEKSVPKNYIKRLMGLPGEILAIFFGRLFNIPAPPPGSPPHFNDVAHADIDPRKLWEPQYMHENESRDLFDAGKFQIIRKPPAVMMALRRIVYDNDYPAKDLAGTAWKRWHPTQGSSWTADNNHGFFHQGSGKDSVDWLRYRHIIRPSGEPAAGARKPQLITDFMSYNSFFVHGWGGDKTPNPNWVGDLMLECQLNVRKAEGEYWMELSKGINRFQARWDLASGKCTLFKLTQDGQRQELDTRPTAIKAPGNYLVRFANIDARLTVWVNRDLPFDDGFAYAPPEVRGPDEQTLDDASLQARRGPTLNDLEPASLGSKGGQVELRHITLWRDTYYTQSAGKNEDVSLNPGDWAEPAHWDAFKRMPTKTMYVQPGHFLCLGDNSQQSSDSRDWGLVPQRLMLGRALMVYFPFDRAGPIR